MRVLSGIAHFDAPSGRSGDVSIVRQVPGDHGSCCNHTIAADRNVIDDDRTHANVGALADPYRAGNVRPRLEANIIFNHGVMTDEDSAIYKDMTA